MATERQYVTMTDLFTPPGIQPGARVRVEGFVDLENEVGMGVSWVPVDCLIEQTQQEKADGSHTSS
jgi:hypothetical protein